MSADKNLFRELVLTPEQLETNRWIMKLDSVAVEYESRWGIGRLFELADTDLRAKWDRQQDKLTEAIRTNNLADLPALVEGTIKGWKALQDAALFAGHKAIDPDFWECAVEGVTYRITRTFADARNTPHAPLERVLTLAEVVRVYHTAHTTAFAPKDVPSHHVPATHAEMMAKGGDPLPVEMQSARQ